MDDDSTAGSGEIDRNAGPRGGAATSAALEDRYGSGRRNRFDRRFAWSAAGILVAAGIGFLVFSGWQNQNQISFQDIGHTVRDDGSVDAKFEVSAPANTPVACAVEALNKAKATVGWKVVELPVTEERTHVVTTNVVTTNPSTAVSTRTCWVLEGDAAKR